MIVIDKDNEIWFASRGIVHEIEKRYNMEDYYYESVEYCLELLQLFKNKPHRFDSNAFIKFEGA